MNIPQAYDYLVRARRDLWAALAGVSDDVLSRPLLNGEKLHCIKDLVFHIPCVEDFWVQEEPVAQSGVLGALRLFPPSRTPSLFLIMKAK